MAGETIDSLTIGIGVSAEDFQRGKDEILGAHRRCQCPRPAQGPPPSLARPNLAIGAVNIQTRATDANGIAGSIAAALRRKLIVAQADPGSHERHFVRGHTAALIDLAGARRVVVARAGSAGFRHDSLWSARGAR